MLFLFLRLVFSHESRVSPELSFNVEYVEYVEFQSTGIRGPSLFLLHTHVTNRAVYDRTSTPRYAYRILAFHDIDLHLKLYAALSVEVPAFVSKGV